MTSSNLRILQIGAGSMGTRRLRDLSQRDDVALAVFDSRLDRRIDAATTYDIPAFATLDEALGWRPHAISISTPPDAHDAYVRLAVECGLHHFCEANIWTPHWRQVEHLSRQRRLVSAPSCTFYFHPLVAKLKRLVSESLGKLHAWQFCLSTYMPDWHPDEGEEYYARRRSTAAAREMVPFELLWLNDVFGAPDSAYGCLGRHAALSEELEDGWYLQLELERAAVGQLSVLMGCPKVWRRGLCLGEHGLIEFDVWCGRLSCRFQDREEMVFDFGPQADLLETIYRNETNAFVDTIHGRTTWPLSYRQASLATAALAAAESSSHSAGKEKIDPDWQPAELPGGYAIHQRDLDHATHRGPHRPISVHPAPNRRRYESRNAQSVEYLSRRNRSQSTRGT